jgi:hypothetical protein
MKQGARNGLAVASVGLLLTLGFACVGADIPNVSNDLRDSLADNFGNPDGARVGASGDGGSASTSSAGAGGNGGMAGDADEPASPDAEASGGAAGGSMASGAAGSGMAGAAGADSEAAAESPAATGRGCDGFGVLETYCATSGCHGMPNAALGDFASSEDAAREFIGVQGRISCAGQGAIIDTDDPEASVLVAKMSDDPPCGTQMPPQGDPLTDEEVACVVEWIGGL